MKEDSAGPATGGDPPRRKRKPLAKQLRLLDVYAVATGATLSAGFFLLPGIAAAQAGPALVLSYLLAALPLVPATFSIVELATAMPRAGGIYYFLDRSLGPLVGTIGGLGTWFALVLKVAFALVGMGAYIALFVGGLPITPVAIGLALALGALNLRGTKKSGGFQVALLAGLLALIAGFIGGGLPAVRPEHFRGFFDAGISAIVSTAGLVYISYIGTTNVASLSEEVRDPERTLPRAIFLSLGTALVVYLLGTAVMVGVVPGEELAGDLTPTATAAGRVFGPWGRGAVAVAAILAFTSVANAGTLSASRYPLAMSRDRMLPKPFRRIGRWGTPTASIAVTVATVIALLALLDPTKIAKLASAFQLLLFATVCLAVIVMRESHIDSYDPGYRSPLYPWMQIAGIVAPFCFLVVMGWLPIAFGAALIAAGGLWYRSYAVHRVTREGAIYHLFERLGRRRYEGLDQELREILKEKGLREEDPFDEVVSRAFVLDLGAETSFEELVTEAARRLADRLPLEAAEIEERFLAGTRVGATPVTHGVALPHIRLAGLAHPEMVLVRSRSGLAIAPGAASGDAGDATKAAWAIFFLVSPAEDPGQHLRLLAQLATRVEEEHFGEAWHAAEDEHDLKEVVLRDEYFLTLRLTRRRTGDWIGRSLRELELPEGTLLTLIQRDGETLFPRGRTVLERGDRVTIIGKPERIQELAERYGDG